MPRGGEAIVARARSLIGVRFRPQGRRRETGLDCIGLAAEAAGAGPVPRDYALRGEALTRLDEGLWAAGFEPVDAARPGDLMVMEAGPAQLHIGIWSGRGLVHGDAGLGRVVERPGPPPWRLLGIWRRTED